ncbi:hypothetical protein CSA37_08855 [Candidatus Fermentibacteria bacterium]|nr:MAG: hypothetical protein CSA37_08855 [Candidatus Fermentibacteria bacterium]
MFTGEEKLIYREHMEEMGADTVEAGPYFCTFTVDMEGNIYTADYFSESYVIDVFSPDGERIRTIEMEPEERLQYDSESHQISFMPVLIPMNTADGSSIVA